MTPLLIAGAVGLLVALFGTPLLRTALIARGIGQHVRTDGPQSHAVKAGTPTMGGIAIIAAGVVGYLVAHVEQDFTDRGLVAVATVILLALVGFLDDWIKQTRSRSLGLNKRGKLAGQLVVALGFSLACVLWLKVGTDLSFTRYDSLDFGLGTVGWVVLAVFVILGTTNGVNLTDGLDGLCAGSSIFVFAALAIIGFVQYKHHALYQNPASLDEAVLAAAMLGACAGFLWWNAAPARIFMGDTGSIGIGAAVAVVALLENIDLLLPVLGGLFVIEVLADIIQITSFRLFHRRVFKMAPIHHHFELMDWPETTVTIRFWIVAAAFSALGLGLFYGDFVSHIHVG